MVHADCAFRMGRTHLVCQDYAAVATGEFSGVLLADGCSGSPDTDVGARLLVRSALPHISILFQQNNESSTESSPSPRLFGEKGPCSQVDARVEGLLHHYHHQAICDARKYADSLQLSDMAFDATLLTLTATETHWLASVFGDGVVVAMNQTGEMEVTVVSYLGGYPFYPNYLADDARRHALLKHKDNLRQVEVFRIDAESRIGEKHCETSTADAPCPYIIGNLADYRWVAALSDGIHSFYTSDMGGSHANTPLPLETVLPELLAFKTTKGQFAQRRIQKFQQQCAARGWQHHDDLSIGVIACS